MKRVEAKTPLEKQETLIQDAERTKSIWRDAMRHEGWQLLVAFLESEYIRYSDMEAESMVKLARRNEALALIRRIFKLIKEDWSSVDLHIAGFEALKSMDSELPMPFDPYRMG